MEWFSKIRVLLVSLGIVFSNGNDQYDCPHWPELLVLGAQKAGTTTLFDALMAHPDVCDAKVEDGDKGFYKKEVHFFDRNMGIYEKGPQFYCSRFTTCNLKKKDPVADAEWIKKALHIDCTPNYLDFHIAERMKKTFSPESRKKIKLIAILRDPTERLLSFYNHVMSIIPLHRHGTEKCKKTPFCQNILRESFNKYTYADLTSKWLKIPQGDHLNKYLNFREFALANNHAVRLGRYADILEEYFDVFDKENILVLNYDFMMNNQRETLSIVSKFVGIGDKWDSNFTFSHQNDFQFNGRLRVEDINCDFLNQLNNYYRPYNNKLYNMMYRFKNNFWSGHPHFRRFNTVSCKDESRLEYVLKM